MLITSRSKLKHIIFAHPHSIVVLNRFGIHLGVGENRVMDIFGNNDAECAFFTSILNTYLFEDHFPQEELMAFSIKKIAQYLRISDFDYLKAILPNVERHFNGLLHRGGQNSNVALLKCFYDEMAAELTAAIDYDFRSLLPMLENESLLSGKTEIIANEKLVGICDEAEAKLDDLLSFFIVHLQGIEEHNLCRAVIDALFTLQRDLRQNNRIRRHILLPMLEKIISCS